MTSEVRNTVIGAGTMGTGIAQCLADHGRGVKLFDVDPVALDRALDQMSANRRFLLEAGLLSPEMAGKAPQLVQTTSDIAQATSDIDLLFEAAPEDLSLKQDLFRELDQLCDEHVAFASNTSGLSITKIASATKRPDRVAGFHWWNPAHLVQLVEVISGEHTSAELIQHLLTLARSLGKRPIHVQRDVPGFVGNRLQFAVFREAMKLISDGVVSPQDLDEAMTFGPGSRWSLMGPIRTADLGGLDVFHSISSYLWSDLSDETSPPKMLSDKVEAGQLGAKSGQGFYSYDADELSKWIEQRDKFLVGLRKLTENLSPDNTDERKTAPLPR